MSIFNIQFSELNKENQQSFEHILPLENINWATVDCIPDLKELNDDFSLTFNGQLLKFETVQ